MLVERPLQALTALTVLFPFQHEDSSPGTEGTTEAEDSMTSPEVFVASDVAAERARPRHESSSSDGTTVTADLAEEVTAEDLVSTAQ